MTRSGRISVALSAQQRQQVRRVVEAGEFASAAAVVREAVAAWLHRRMLHAGPHGAARLARSFQAGREAPVGEIVERVELLFDAGDAKA